MGRLLDFSPATRRTFLGACLAGGLGLSVELDATPSAAATGVRDTDILNYALGLEYLQRAFYEEAVAKGALSGGLARFARVVAGHERAHVDALRRALGHDAAKPPRFVFGRATTDPEAFVPAAIELEDLAVFGYNGAAPALSPNALVAAAQIVSVDARHAAWIRALDGRRPAVKATDPGRSVDQVSASVDRLGFRR
jgi:Ferritin-like domain